MKTFDPYIISQLEKIWNEDIYLYTEIPTNFFYRNSPSIFVDTSKTYKLFNIPMCLIIPNSYDADICDGFIAITVSLDPEILYMSNLCHLVNSDINFIFNFIKNNYSILIDIANMTSILEDELTYMQKQFKIKEYLNESMFTPLYKMATFTVAETNLCTDIWVDLGNIWKNNSKHGPRIKAKGKGCSNDTHTWVSITVPNGKPYNNQTKSGEDKIKPKELRNLQRFIFYNLDLFKEINSRSNDNLVTPQEFKKWMTRLTNNNEPIEPIEKRIFGNGEVASDYKIIRHINSDFILVKKDSGEENIFNNITKELISNQDFATFLNFTIHENKIEFIYLDKDYNYIKINVKK